MQSSISISVKVFFDKLFSPHFVPFDIGSVRHLENALEEQNINTFRNDLTAEAGDKPICDLDLDKAAAVAHGGMDRIRAVRP